MFCALLDDERGGRFRIHPVASDEELTRKQMYLPDTNVLITRFLAAQGVGEVSDFMPVAFYPYDHPRQLVRRVKTVRGAIHYNVRFEPRFDYARADHTVEQRDGELLFASKGHDGTVLRLRTDVPLTITDDGAAVADLRAARRRDRRVRARGGRARDAEPVGCT